MPLAVHHLFHTTECSPPADSEPACHDSVSGLDSQCPHIAVPHMDQRALRRVLSKLGGNRAEVEPICQQGNRGHVYASVFS